MNHSPRPHLLIVCTANAIRSPFVEHLLRARLAKVGADVVIASAGTAARPGRSAEPQVIDLGRSYGIELERHRTRRLDETMLGASTTVLCASSTHRRVVLDLRPDALERTFTLREFARLVAPEQGPIPDAEWGSLVRTAARRRTRARPASVADDDLVDPVGQPAPVWQEFERHAVEAVERIAALAGRSTIARGTGPRPMTRREFRARLVAGEPSPTG